MQAVLSTTVPAVLSLLLPPLMIISSAVVGLVTLRLGGRRGGEVMLLALVASAILGQLALGGPTVAIAMLVVWLPIYALALMLRLTSSLSLTVQTAMVLGIVPLLLELYYFSSSGTDWQTFLEPLKQSLIKAQLIGEAESQALMEWMALWLTGIFAAGLFIQICLGLFLARHWQAKLYNPGGFGAEFRAFKVSRPVAYVAAAVLMFYFLLNGGDWALVRTLMMVLVALFFLQGLAVLHALLNGAQGFWLIGVYLLLLFALPYMVMTLAATGFADAWWNFRLNAGAGRSNGDGSADNNE